MQGTLRICMPDLILNARLQHLVVTACESLMCCWCCCCRDKLLGNPEPKLPQQNGMAFTLSVAHQSNITVVVTRAINPSSEQRSTSFEDAAERTATAAGFLFDASSRAQRGMTRI